MRVPSPAPPLLESGVRSVSSPGIPTKMAEGGGSGVVFRVQNPQIHSQLSHERKMFVFSSQTEQIVRVGQF